MARGIFERPNGSGVWWIRYTDQFGKLHREKVGPKSLAQAAYQKRKTEIREGKFFPEKIQRKKELLFKDMATMYIEEHAKVNKGSWKTDVYNMKSLLEFFGDKSLSEISQQDIERFRSMLIRDLTPATVNRRVALLKTIFNKAITWGKTDRNPANGIKRFRENNTRIRFLAQEEEERLKSVFPQEYWPFVEIAINTGMRRGEQFGLRWSNVNFQTQTITIPRSKHGETRHIPMNDTVQTILRNLPSRMKSEWVFPSQTSETPKNAQNFINRVFMPALNKAGIENFRWHDLRHTFASRLVMSGEDLRTVQELMGHKTITMTLRYAHLSPGHLMKAVQRLVPKPTDTNTDTAKKKGLADIS